MSKSNLISELYNETVQKVSSSPQEWKKFLSVACRNYKLRYDEQLLLYAQRPDAVAVLTYAEWISRFKRHVNKGSKGIAVFDKDLNGDLIKYYFDIQDTAETERSIPVPIWQMKESYNNDVLLNLERTFGHIDNKDNFTLALVNCVNHVVAQNIPSYIGDMLTAKSANLPDMNTDTFIETYQEIVAESVSYSILSRLNISAESML